MEGTEEYVNERMDHLGIVAGVCQEIGLAAWLNAQEPGNRQQVSVGTATVAMVLNGLGFSNRQLYLVPQFFATKPIEHLLGPGITAEMLNDDCLGRTRDWLYKHDLTKLFAGIASQARRIFGVKAEHIHVDTTSFSVSGEYAREADAASDSQAAIIAITYGYSRDHREDLKQWMLALATTQEGDIPLFMQPLNGNSSDKASLLAAIIAIQTQLRDTDGEASVYVADNGVYSEANMRQLNQANVKWISRVSETMTEAQALLEEGSESWQQSEDGVAHWFSRELTLPQGRERWTVVYTQASVERARQTMLRQMSKAQQRWKQACWHFSNRRFACEADARAALERELKGKPSWLDVHSDIIAHPQYSGKGRPHKEATPTGYQWQIVAAVSVNFLQVAQEVLHKACWIVGTNVLEPAVLSDQVLIGTYKDQGGVERGFRFLKDPLFLASSVFVKKPERIMALGFIMVLCLLVYRLAEFRLRSRLVQTQQTIPDQVHKPTERPTMRWIFQCFEGIELLHVQTPTTSRILVLRLQPLHRLILHLLGPLYEKFYLLSG
jgi:transposase